MLEKGKKVQRHLVDTLLIHSNTVSNIILQYWKLLNLLKFEWFCLQPSLLCCCPLVNHLFHAIPEVQSIFY